MSIETPEEFEKWLKQAPHNAGVIFFARAALRVLPLITVGSGRSDVIAASHRIVAARAILTSMVVTKVSGVGITSAARAAAKGREATSWDSHCAFACAVAVYGIDDTQLAETIEAYRTSASVFVDDAHVALDSDDTRHRVEDESMRALTAMLVDVGLEFDELVNTPLWHGDGAPDWYTFPITTSHGLPIYDDDWAFWRDWYQGFLDGKPMDWELQRRVALITETIWEAGPEAVAEEIERIRAEYLAEKTPQAERVEFNPETAKFFTIPIEIAKPDLLGATLTQVEDALDDALANPSNGLHDQSREVRVLRRIATKYGNDPQQIEMGFVSVHAGLTRQVLSDELPQSEENLALQAAVEEGVRAIRATHPEVAENRKILSEQVISELPEGAKEKLEDALPVLRAISEPELADDWDHDIPTLINDATGPLLSGAPALPGADEAMRIFSRVAKISILIRTTKAIKSHPLYESGEVLLTLSGLIGLGTAIFALLI